MNYYTILATDKPYRIVLGIIKASNPDLALALYRKLTKTPNHVKHIVAVQVYK